MGKDKQKKKSDVRKIMKTTDGYFTQNDHIKKPRSVAVVKQRKRDGALAVAKIHTPEGKKSENFVKGVVLKPENHSSLKKDSVVSKKIIVGTKDKDKNYKPIYKGDLVDTGDKLTKKEHRKILKGAGGTDKEHHKSEKKKVKRWEQGFRK